LVAFVSGLEELIEARFETSYIPKSSETSGKPSHHLSEERKRVTACL
jgi:hypothetical protein